MVPCGELPVSLTSVSMLPLPCCTDPDQVPSTAAGSVTAGDGDRLAAADGDGERDAAGWLAEAGVTARAGLPELASCSTCTAAAIASTQTAAAAAQPIALARRGRAGGAGCVTPGGGSAGGRIAALAARLDPSASTPAGGLSWPSSRTTACRAAGRAPGSGVPQLATRPRSGSGRSARSNRPDGLLPVPANTTACAQASMSAAGVAVP